LNKYVKILKYLEYEDLPDDLKMICDDIGIDNVRKIIESNGGLTIYIPQPKYFREAILRGIQAEFPNLFGEKIYKTKDIARAFNIAESTAKNYKKELNLK